MRHEESGLVNRIDEYRARDGLSQGDLARLVGVSRKTINTIERGRFVPSTVLALRLAAAFGCTVEDLFRIEE